MTAKERAINFIQGKTVDRIPFHPLVMQYAAQKTNTLLSDYYLDYKAHCNAMITFSRKYGMDCTHASGYPYCEAEAYGLNVTYPSDDLPFAREYLIKNFSEDINKIRHLNIQSHKSMMNRIHCISLNNELVGDELFICGHVEGPFAEYCDLRGTTEAFMDMYDYDEQLLNAFQIITDNSKNWIDMQIQAGCHCIDIGEAVCSQISEDMYIEKIYPFHKQLIKHIHSRGVFAKFHICGDSSRVIPHLINAKANIIDVDSLVKNIVPIITTLGENQVLCGNIHPVDVIKNGTPQEIDAHVKNIIDTTQRKCIIAAGCEIPKDTPEENYKAFYEATINYS